MIKILFVCHANICRSPMAEGVFNHKLQQAGLEKLISADSAGVSPIHAGEPAHPGTVAILALLGVQYAGISRPLTEQDFFDYDYILAMDKDNLRHIRRVKPAGSTARIAMFLDYATGTSRRELEDPCFTERFKHVYRIVDDATSGLLAAIQMEHQLE